MDYEKEKIVIKDEFRNYTKPQLVESLKELGIHATGREKKEDLLEMIASFIIASREEAENRSSESKSTGKHVDTPEKAKKPAEAKKGGSAGRRKSGSVPEITKERRENVSNFKKTREKALEDEAAISKAYGEDATLKPRQIKNAPQSLTIDGTRKPQKDILPEDFELTESMTSPAVILKGELHMVVEDRFPWVRKKNPHTGEIGTYYQVAAVIRYYSRFVYIPAEYFFEDYWEMDQSKMRMFVEEREGAEVEFRVVSVNRDDPQKPVYIASRIAALKKRRCDYWYSEREKGQALLQPDSVHEAKVVAVSKRFVFVEMYGAEIVIPEKEITYNRIRDLRMKYLPGDVVDVKIKSVVLQDKNRAEALDYPVSCRVSIKDAQPDPRDKYFVQDLKNVKFRGIIRDKDIDENNITWYWVEMGVRDNYEEGMDEGLTIRCRLGDDVAVIPQIDDIASGKMTFSNDKQKRVFGTIYHIDPPRRRQRRRY